MRTAHALAGRFHAVSWRQEEQRDWVAMSRANWEPLLVGERFFLVPEWRSDAAPEGRFRIAVNPGMAFGTGMHETTQLCLEALEAYVRPGVPVLDVGTGAGILAQAAALLGAGPVWACDIDPQAVEIARGNMPGPTCLSDRWMRCARGRPDVIAANISPETIARLAPELLRCLRPDGVALVSGFERHEAADGAGCAGAAGRRTLRGSLQRAVGRCWWLEVNSSGEFRMSTTRRQFLSANALLDSAAASAEMRLSGRYPLTTGSS